jgi:hypothetical protein
MATSAGAGWWRKAARLFFFGRKRSKKTFVPGAVPPLGPGGEREFDHRKSKSFLVLFFKKERAFLKHGQFVHRVI